MFFRIIVTGGTIAGLATAALPRSGRNDPTSDVLAMERATCAAYQRNDARALDSLVADGYALTDSKGSVTTKQDDLRDARERTVDFTEFRNFDMQVTLFGPTAIVRGKTVVKGKTKSGDVVDIVVQFTDTVALIGGRWRLVAGHVSRLPH